MLLRSSGLRLLQDIVRLIWWIRLWLQNVFFSAREKWCNTTLMQKSNFNFCFIVVTLGKWQIINVYEQKHKLFFNKLEYLIDKSKYLDLAAFMTFFAWAGKSKLCEWVPNWHSCFSPFITSAWLWCYCGSEATLQQADSRMSSLWGDHVHWTGTCSGRVQSTKGTRCSRSFPAHSWPSPPTAKKRTFIT